MDQDRANAFLFKVFGDVATSAAVACLSIGDRTGLFGAMRGAGHLTPAQLAARAGLHTRYVEEWLAAMAAGGYVEYDPDAGTFCLPDEHAVVLADTESTRFLGGLLQMAPAVVRQADRVAASFVEGGGVHFAEFGEDFVEGMERANAPNFANVLTRRWIPLSDTSRRHLDAGRRVLDVGCGSGRSSVAIATAWPRVTVVAVEPDARSLVRARNLALEHAVADRIEFLAIGAEDLTFEGEFGVALSVDVVHDMADPRCALEAVHRALAPDGVYLMAEPNCSSDLRHNLHPVGTFFYSISVLHCLTQSLAVGGEGLGAGWGREAAADLARAAGFRDVRELDLGNPITAMLECRA